MENTETGKFQDKKFQKPGFKDRLGDSIEKAGQKISDAGAEKLGQKIHDLGDRIEKRHDDPAHPKKV